jgi:[histone H3]-lysine9 N-trimethyltransferase SUV39H
MFVALSDINAGTEFTFDYHPEAAGKKLKKKKGKSRKKIPKDSIPCLCNSIRCRGYLLVDSEI